MREMIRYADLGLLTDYTTVKRPAWIEEIRQAFEKKFAVEGWDSEYQTVEDAVACFSLGEIGERLFQQTCKLPLVKLSDPFRVRRVDECVPEMPDFFHEDSETLIEVKTGKVIFSRTTWQSDIVVGVELVLSKNVITYGFYEIKPPKRASNGKKDRSIQIRIE